MKPMIDTIKHTIEQAKSIAIFGHEYVDGDCLGAMLGFGKILSSQDKKVSYFTPYPVGSSLQFVPGREQIQTIFDYQTYDILLFLDFSGYDRIKAFTAGHEEYFDKNTVVIFDHHQGDHPSSTDLVLKDIQVSSSCELIYEYIKQRRPTSITPQIATYLYLGLTTDSGNFMYEKDSARLFQNALGLVQAGADKKRVLDHTFYRNTFDMVKFSNTIIHRAQQTGDILRTYYDDDEIEKYKIDKDQADFGFYTLKTIYGPTIYIRLRKTGTSIRGSVRGNGTIDCATLCQKLFNGGGHFNAAGFSTEQQGSAQESMKVIIQKIQDYIDINKKI